MKHKLALSMMGLTVLLFICLIIYLYFPLINNSSFLLKKEIDLNKKYKIVAYQDNINKCCIMSNNDEVLIPPIITTFWGSYPYLYGQALNQDTKTYYFFLFNVESGEIVKDNINSELNRLGLSPFGAYEQISLGEYFSKDSNIDNDRIMLFKKNMHIQ